MNVTDEKLFEVASLEQQLVSAAEKGFLIVVQAVLDTGIELDDFLWTKTPRLTGAVGNGHIDCVRIILKRALGVDLEATDIGVLFFPVAASFGRLECLKQCIDLGAQVNQLVMGRSALYWASSRSHMRCVAFLLNAGANPNLFSDTVNNAPLSVIETAECAQLLVEHGANVNAVDQHGNSALTNAVSRCNFTASKYLLEHGANPNLYVSDEKTFAMYSAPPLIIAVKSKTIKLVVLLIDHGANLEATDGSRQTSVIWAAKSQYVEIMRLLLKHGANAGAEDSEGCTALHYIAMKGRGFYLAQNEDAYFVSRCQKISSIVRLLAAHNADPDAIDERGRTPLSFAIEEKYCPIIGLLLEYGARSTGRLHRSVLEIARKDKGAVAATFREYLLKFRLRKIRGISRFLIVYGRYRKAFSHRRRFKIGRLPVTMVKEKYNKKLQQQESTGRDVESKEGNANGDEQHSEFSNAIRIPNQDQSANQNE